MDRGLSVVAASSLVWFEERRSGGRGTQTGLQLLLRVVNGKVRLTEQNISDWWLEHGRRVSCADRLQDGIFFQDTDYRLFFQILLFVEND